MSNEIIAKFKHYNENRKKINIKNINITERTNKATIAIIIPHRKRIDHLKKFIEWINKLDKKQNKFDLYIIDQNNFDRFNRGLLLNIGYYIAHKNYSYDRYIFHDVDSYPTQELFDLYFKNLDDNIHFASPHLGYKYTFENFLGGVIGLTNDTFNKINGFPNTFFGWGGEDDALYNRLASNNIIIYRPTKGKYILGEHNEPKEYEMNNVKYENILSDLTKWKENGLNQMETIFINYKQFKLDNFMNTYTINESNILNKAGLLTNYEKVNNNINTIKIDYLAVHFKNKDSYFLIHNYIEHKINKNILKLKELNNGVYQHKQNPIYMSVIEPILYWEEIEEKIINTYTKPKKFINKFVTNKRTEKINNILKTETSNYKNKLSVSDLKNTLRLIYDNYNEIIYIRIRNNKIDKAYHINSTHCTIDWYKNLKYKSEPIDKSSITVLEDLNKHFYTVKNPHFQPANNCLIGLDSYNYFEGNSYTYINNFMEMIKYTIDQFGDVPDCDLLLNRKDFPYLRKDNKYSYEHLNDEKIINPPKKYWMIGSQSKRDYNLDIPIPSSDEWDVLNQHKKFTTEWSEKKPVAIFRGATTGCGSDETNNLRIKLADISYKNKDDILDVALSHITKRPRVYKKNIYIINEDKYKHLLGSFINNEEQSKNKYVFNIEGNAQAYRFPTEFRKRSVILNVKSDFKMWFEPLLVNNKHFIEIDNNYNNVIPTIKNLIENDDKASKIARNGYRFCKKYISKQMIATYWYYYMIYSNEFAL